MMGIIGIGGPSFDVSNNLNNFSPAHIITATPKEIFSKLQSPGDGIATGCGLHVQGLIPGKSKIFSSFPRRQRLPAGARPRRQLVTGAKRPGSEADC
jgi:hypothetical protein